MGTLRFLLAATVAYGHVMGANMSGVLTDSGTAVQAFYIISGFLIAFILNERYARLGDFYRSRLLRLMPGYYFWLIA
jgi:peptidoglycan/LPS O-acetylase OafA/YrhL